MNAVAGLAAVNVKYGGHDSSYSWVDGPDRDAPEVASADDARDGRWTPADRLSAYVASQTMAGRW